MKKILGLLLIVPVMHGPLLGEFKNLQTHLNDAKITKKCLENSQAVFSDSTKGVLCISLNLKFDTLQEAYKKAFKQKMQLKEVQHTVSEYLNSKKERS